MYRIIIARLAAVAAAGATAVLLAGPAQAATAGAAGKVSGKELISGVAFGKNAISNHTTYPLTFTGLVRTTSLFTPPGGNRPAVLPTPKGGLGAMLVRPMRGHLVSLDRRTCYGVEQFTAGLRVVTSKSTGVFAGATGKGGVSLMFGAFLPRKHGACNPRGNPVSAKDAFSTLNAKIALTLRK
jgi:hypothetical protein